MQIEKPLVSREQALALGIGKFYTGRPCKHGHVAERYASNKSAGKCVECVSIRHKRQYHNDPEYRERALERVRFRWASDEGFRKRQKAHKNKSRGMPEPTRPSPVICECCGSDNNFKVLSLDHCHISGKFRGWLCNSCNTGLGLLGDSTARLRKALAYLEAADGV